MLLNDLFILNSTSTADAENKTRIEANLSINKTHHIFNGHFPGLPIVPGVCMVQIIKELVEKQLNRKLTLREAGNVKFLSMINPDVNHEVNAEIRFIVLPDSVHVDCQLHFGGVTFFKIKAEFVNRAD
jgi:3-hydroxyacyl-[acyl-carrier-protein] dehydratase